LRWSRFKNEAPSEMFVILGEHVFPFLRTLGSDDSTYAHHMKDARFTIPTPALLAKAVELLDAVPMDNRDTKGDLYEYMLRKIVRGLVGLDREAATQALNGFVRGNATTANQLEFVNLIVTHLTERGVMEPGLLYEPPFKSYALEGPDVLFTSAQVDELFGVQDHIKATARAAKSDSRRRPTSSRCVTCTRPTSGATPRPVQPGHDPRPWPGTVQRRPE
jgi:hypothetical protein